MTRCGRAGVALAALAAAVACAETPPPVPEGAAVAAREARFVITYEASAPPGPDAAGQLRIRIEPRSDWHITPEAPARLVLEGSPGLELDPAEQQAEDAVQRTAEGLEFASAFRSAQPRDGLVRGRLKFGMCEGEDTRCYIIRRDLEMPLDVALR